MTGPEIATIVTLLLLVPILFQLILLGQKQEKRHREIVDLLKKLDQSGK
jgi:preprotein translocase subunit YajC